MAFVAMDFKPVSLAGNTIQGQSRFLVLSRARNPFVGCLTSLRRRKAAQFHQFRLTIVSSSPGFDFVSSILTKFPDAPLVASTVAALTLAGGSYAYSKENSKKSTESSALTGIQGGTGYWLLALKPTHFNKFVIARCPSICLDSNIDIHEDHVYPKLNLVSHQLVALETEPVMHSQAGEIVVETEYQRTCIPADDGGVLALDWPTCLDLERDHGLDTTLLLVPGTPKGSQDEAVKLFVQKALKSGFFPIVLNPRGCANSPLTTTRIFSAADSDDVRAAVAYIGKSRPWTTLMGIGWGYGANMLTKYLAEDNSSSPLTAAVSINSPFNLNDSTKYIRQNCHGDLDKELTEGLVQILKSNKMLFQGHRDKFDVAGGLIATSIREFDAAITCLAHGYRRLDNFYASASSGEHLDDLKVPLLCIQDSSAAPLFSIPQSTFEGNPYTTLLYTSAESEKVNWNVALNFALEWFAAVEVAFLKGRHPVLQGVDVAIKPSKEWTRTSQSALIGEMKYSQEGQQEDKYIVVEHKEDVWTPHDVVDVPHPAEESSQENTLEVPEENTEESGQVLQAAQTVFGALDVVMPGTLTDESKKQVLDAVGRGESIITALQNAVPEDVRGKLVTSVSAAVQARGMSLQLVGFGKNIPPPTLPAGLKESIQEKLSSVTKSGILGDHKAEITVAQKVESKATDTSSKPEAPKTELDKFEASEAPKAEPAAKDESSEAPKAEPAAKDESSEAPKAEPAAKDESSEAPKAEPAAKDESSEAPKAEPAAKDESSEAPKAEAEKYEASKPEAAKSESSPPEAKATIHEVKNEADSGEKPGDGEKNDAAPAQVEATKSAVETIGVKSEAAKPTESNSSVPNINMKQAFEALTGFDDSTQMAMNNVFGVLEDILEKLEKEHPQGKNEKEQQKVEIGTQENVQKEEVQKSEKEQSKDQQEKSTAKQMVDGNRGSDDSQGKEEHMDELNNVRYRLKKTKISGFVLDENEPTQQEQTYQESEAATIVLHAMRNEVQRRLGSTTLENIPGIEAELRLVADAVMREVQYVHASEGSSSKNILPAEGLVNAVASSLRKTNVLRQVVPVGLLVGVTLASLATSFEVIRRENGKSPSSVASLGRNDEQNVNHHDHPGTVGGRMVGAVTAAMGATAAFATTPFRGKEEAKAAEKESEQDHHQEQENPVASIADKAVSVAAPVVPHTKDGEVDHDKLVAMLAQVGQKAGFLKFVGKAALLWGGLRGAMNVTDRLLLFFHIAERPLHQRLFGFAGTLLIMWSPVFVPLLPSLLNEWASNSAGGVAKFASGIGLYGALLILVTIWGRKIRGYEQPLQNYGLRLEKNKLKSFTAGLIAGCAAAASLHYWFSQLGYVRFVPILPVTSSFRQAAVSVLKLLKLTAQALTTGVAVSVVEEVFFRSWLLEEIAADLGHQKAIILSGLVFAILHWSPAAIPGLWFLAIALASLRHRAQGDLSLPIGLHAGLIAANYMLTSGGCLVYLPGSSNWITGFRAGNPLAGLLGAAIACVVAALLYPWKVLLASSNQEKKASNVNTTG